MSGASSSLAYWSGKGGGKEQGADKAGVTQLGTGTASEVAAWKQANYTHNGTTLTFRLLGGVGQYYLCHQHDHRQ